ncbi:Uncharacterized protein FKW44_004141, partial [Caligus rogercresseyi]
QRSLNAGPTKKKSSSGKKTQWTVLCVSLTLLTMCVTLVGTMLSVGSQYPEMLIARRWDQLLNESRMHDEEEQLHGAINKTLAILLPNNTHEDFTEKSLILSSILQNTSSEASP